MLWKLFQLSVALALIAGGALLLIAWEHPISIIWTAPSEIFWSTNVRSHEGGGLYWWIGPMLIAAGALWIAEDWFGLGRYSSKDSASPSGKRPILPAYDHDQPKRPPSST